MSKIVIVGHPHSGYQKLEDMLISCGMQPAMASKNEKLSPAEISSVLRQAHKVPSIEDICSEGDIMQIDPGPVWNGLALDLMLGNLKQDVWGWSDPQAIFLLEYWKALDPDITFLLAYNEPHSVFYNTDYKTASELSSESVFRVLDNWTAYNAALLRFYLRNTDRSMLLNLRQGRHAADYYLGQLKSRFGTLLREPAVAASTHNGVAVAQHGYDQPYSVSTACHSSPLNGPNGHGKSEADLFLIDTIIALHPESLQLYEELQSISNLPRYMQNDAPAQPTDAWLALVKQRLQSENLLSSSIEARKQVEQRLQEQKNELKKLQFRLDTITIQLQDKREEYDGLQKTLTLSLKKSSEENDMLLAQLHGVQKELERYYLENKNFKQKAEEKSAEISSLRERRNQLKTSVAELQEQRKELLARKNRLIAKLEEVEQTNKSLSRLADESQQQMQILQEKESLLTAKLEEVEQTNKSLSQLANDRQQQILTLKREREEQIEKMTAAHQSEIQKHVKRHDMIVAHMHKAQEELERYYLKEKERKRQAEQKKKPAYYGAADRIKNQLSYRLGAVLIQRSRSFSGWLGMPFALAHETRAYRRDKAARSGEKLPPITAYRDVQEAEKVKRHLSYRLGSIMVRHASSPVGWIQMPFLLQREARSFRQQRNQDYLRS